MVLIVSFGSQFRGGIGRVAGKEVYNNKLVITKGNANFDLDLPNGVYHVKLIGSSGVASQKLVISK